MAVIEPQKSIKSVQHLSNLVVYSGKMEKVAILENLHLKDLATYASSDSMVNIQLMSFIGCTQDNILCDFENAKLIHRSTNGPIAYHYIQSFKPGEVTPMQAHEVGVEFVNKIAPGYQLAIYTHVDKEHIHNHIVINSVNLETGYRWNKCDASLRHMREISDEICLKHDLSIIRKTSTLKPIDRTTNILGEQGKSWKVNLTFCIDNALEVCQNKQEFIDYLINSNFNVKYTDDNIVVQKTGEVKAIRLDRIAEQFGCEYTKVSIEKKLDENSRREIPERLTDPLLNIMSDDNAYHISDIDAISWKSELLNDLDDAISTCKSRSEFVEYMSNADYDVKYQNVNISILKNGEKKAIRVDTLARKYGDNYSKESIENHMKENAAADVSEDGTSLSHLALINNNGRVSKLDTETPGSPLPKTDNESFVSKLDTGFCENTAENSSWRKVLVGDLSKTLEECKSKEEFIKLLNSAGYSVEWQNKNISILKFGEKKAVRVDTLAKYYGKQFTKDNIEKKLKANASWMLDYTKSVEKVLQTTHKKEEFIKSMKKSGFDIDFTDAGLLVKPVDSEQFIKSDVISKYYGFKYKTLSIEKALNIEGVQKQLDKKDKSQPNVSEWDRYTRWHFKNQERLFGIRKTDLYLVNSLKNSILYSKDMKSMIVRLIVLSIVMLNKNRRNGYKEYKKWHKKKGMVEKPIDTRTFQNISYYRLINSEGDNLTIKIKPQQVSMLFNKPLFYSAKVYQDGRAYVTIKAKDEELFIKTLGISPKDYERERELNHQKDNYHHLKEESTKNNSKLIYKEVNEQSLNVLKDMNFDMAYFKNNNSYTICFNSNNSEEYKRLCGKKQADVLESTFEYRR